MPEETLEEVRLLSNLESNRHKLLQIVLFGQPELDASLAKPSLRQLRDRITHGFRMRPLSLAEVQKYVGFRMRAAGYRGPEVFGRRAIAAHRARGRWPHAAHQHPRRQGAARGVHRELACRHGTPRARGGPRCRVRRAQAGRPARLLCGRGGNARRRASRSAWPLPAGPRMREAPAPIAPVQRRRLPRSPSRNVVRPEPTLPSTPPDQRQRIEGYSPRRKPPARRAPRRHPRRPAARCPTRATRSSSS